MYYSSSSDDSDDQVLERKLDIPIKRHNQQNASDNPRDISNESRDAESAEIKLTDLLSGLDLNLTEENVKEEEWGCLQGNRDKNILTESVDQNKGGKNQETYIEKNPSFRLDGKESEKVHVKRFIDNKDNTRYLVKPKNENVIIDIPERQGEEETPKIIVREPSPQEKEQKGDISFVIWLMMMCEGEYPEEIISKVMESEPIQKLSKRELVKEGVRLIERMQHE